MKKKDIVPAAGPAPDLGAGVSGDNGPHEGPFEYADYVRGRDTLSRAALAGHFYGTVTGPSGTGKSSLGRDLATELERPRFQIVYLSSSAASVVGLLSALARALRASPKRTALETSQVVMQALKAAAPTRYVLWLDEADQVSAETLAEIRILAESDLDSTQLLSVVLSGLPELRTLLDERKLFPLKRRISVRCQLTGLSRAELSPFLVHRHGSVAARRIPAGLHDEIFERTEAIPALVHKVARIALERAGAETIVTESILREAFDAAGL